MTAPAWLLRSVIDAVHDAQLAEHGGAAGLRDEGALDSAFARPANLHAYGETDIFHLAAAYAFGIVRNRPFVDGNKRTAFLAAYVFLCINGHVLEVDEVGAATAVLALAADEISEDEFSEWLRVNCRAP
ncbi:MAG: type II toxin-antitoxin system death-on-curing family toxin, partial [Hyphomicrobiales bacterium]|nr:type II toxin-antitoxin system death-on-curing family toxin [Hyphomicrobiales bacterium]